MKIIEREITTTGEGKPCMVLRPIAKYDKVHIDRQTGKPFKKRSFILLDNLWMYSETHNPDGFLALMTQKTMYLCRLFEIPVPTRKQQFVQLMMSIADTIQDGIDALVSTPPIPAQPEEPSSIIRVKPIPLSGMVTSGTLH